MGPRRRTQNQPRKNVRINTPVGSPPPQRRKSRPACLYGGLGAQARGTNMKDNSGSTVQPLVEERLFASACDVRPERAETSIEQDAATAAARNVTRMDTRMAPGDDPPRRCRMHAAGADATRSSAVNASDAPSFE